jgi:4-diphosphocytidyl-2-C-methyl-D-erythritol kinase
MIGFPHAKINLGLSVISKRADGFHDLETVFYPVPFRDILEFIPAPVTSLISSGLFVAGEPKDNLVIRAYALLKTYYPGITALTIHLYKSIPAGAGLGGGSSDAAFMLNLLNEYFRLNISTEKLTAFALELGSDCPFFLQSSPCFAGGRGEKLEPVALDLSGYSILLIQPETHISTAWAFSRIKPGIPEFRIREVITAPLSQWRNRLRNDFEIPVFQQYPELKKIKARLYEAGAIYASLTGSGSGLYGIFPKNEIPRNGIDTEARQHFLL